MDKQSLEQTRLACAQGQKRGLHFIMASVLIWAMVFIVHMTQLPIGTKNLLTFCCTCPLMPIAWLLSKPLGITFNDKDNPLTSLGIIFSCAQLPYLLIVSIAAVLSAKETKAFLLFCNESCTNI